MIVCPKCQTELPDGDRFCKNCGKKLAAPAQRGRQTAAKKKRASAKVKGSGTVVQGKKNVTATHSGVAVGGSVYGDIYTGVPPKDDAKALMLCRYFVAQQTGRLPLRGIDVKAADASASQKQLDLAKVYVDLDTRAQVKLTKAEKQKRERERSLPGEEATRPLGALEALIANRRLVLLGDPGGGKSTFVNHVAFCLASHALQPEVNWIAHLPNWPTAEAGLLPLVIILRDFARQLPDPLPRRAEPIHLWNYLAEWLKSKNLAEAGEAVQRQLRAGQALVLLDGLDEVPSVAQRIFVRDAVQAFMTCYPRNRFVITCRVLSYQPPVNTGDPDLRLADQPSFELAPFDAPKIDRFITAWYDELAQLGVVRRADQAGLTRQLIEAVRRPDLWRLAPNPLLLTVMALVHTHQGRLPDARALLYEETIDILLWRWEQVKLGGEAETPRLRQLLLEARRTEVDLKRTLWQLAYDAHTQGDGADQNRLADIGELKLEKALAALKGDDRTWAGQMIEAMKLRAGLLLERAPEVFTFPHRTFQEYLAGAHLAAQANFARESGKLAEQGALWHEVILLAVGRLVYLFGDIDKPLALVAELCPRQANQSVIGWSKAWLAGDALLEIGPERACDNQLGCDLLERVQDRLAALLQAGALSPRERAAAGNTLARLGDPRFLADAWHLPVDLPLGFVEIPAGPFIMGTRAEDIPALLKRYGGQREWYERETPQHTVKLPTFYLARYPVTVAQFAAFVADSDYRVRDADSLRGVPTHPVVNVTWHEAIAYCDWLTAKLRAWQQTPEPLATLLRDKQWRVMLPSEAEWEKGGRGGGGGPREFPWGDDPDPDCANYANTEINTTSVVGCFPRGASHSYGVLDLSGNVWEWTRSLFGRGGDLEHPYPYDPNDRRREDLKATDEITRVLRGGAFFNYEWDVRCAYRFRFSPNVRFGNFGFRICVSSPF